jgi:hypothetical protein
MCVLVESYEPGRVALGNSGWFDVGLRPEICVLGRARGSRLVGSRTDAITLFCTESKVDVEPTLEEFTPQLDSH